jgi:hypothetical protein
MAVRFVYHVSISHACEKAPDHIPIASKTEKAGFTTEIAEYAEFFIHTFHLCAQCLSREIPGNLLKPRKLFRIAMPKAQRVL